jgi:hypothetical protein
MLARPSVCSKCQTPAAERVADSIDLARRSKSLAAAAGFDFESAIALFWAAIHCLCVTSISSIGSYPVEKASNVHNAMFAQWALPTIPTGRRQGV